MLLNMYLTKAVEIIVIFVVVFVIGIALYNTCLFSSSRHQYKMYKLLGRLYMM